MNALSVSLLARLAVLTATLLLLPACGKKESTQAGPPKQESLAPKTPVAETPIATPAQEPTVVPAASAAAPVLAPELIPTPAPTPAPAVKKPAPVKPTAPAVYVRAGPLVKARRLADYLGTLRPGEISLKLTLHTGDNWTIRQPAGGINLADLPPFYRTPWLHLETVSGGVLVPFSTLKSMVLLPVSREKDRARARVVLQDGTELAGVVQGQLGGESEYGRLEVPWRALKLVELINQDKVTPAESLPLAGKGAARLADGIVIEFTSWAPMVGDVLSDVLLAEAGTGPEVVPLASGSTLEITGQDPQSFFYQHAVTLTPGGQASIRRNVALSGVLLQQANGCIVCLLPTALQGLVLTPR